MAAMAAANSSYHRSPSSRTARGWTTTRLQDMAPSQTAASARCASETRTEAAAMARDGSTSLINDTLSWAGGCGGMRFSPSGARR